MSNDFLSKINNLSDKEKNITFQILKDLAKNGKSAALENIKYADYAEIPVDIETFLKDPRYLGKALVDEEGRFTVFPYWVDMLKKLFPTNLDTTYNNLILSGAIGLGKSFIAVICMLYMLYRTMCLKNPYTHYGLQEIDHITFSLMNITMEAAKGVAWAKLQEIVQKSPWFLERGTLSKSLQPQWQPNGGIELVCGSQPRHVIGRCVFCSFEDEISFQLNQDIDKQKKKAMTLISSIDARMQSRFMKGEKLPTLHILASSKRTDQSFLESYIDLKRRNDSKSTLIIDEPQWVIRTDKDSPKKFPVAVGNKFLENEVLPIDSDETLLQEYRDKGYSILMVPIGYYEKFIDDIDIALTDIAGISTSNTTRYISGARWSTCRDNSLKNPFTKEIITVGNALDDQAQYSDFFDLSLIPRDMISKPLYIHLDMSMTGDKTGIAGVWIKGKKIGKDQELQSKDLVFQIAFSVSIKAPKGHQISFEKNRNFIRWLKQQGFNIKEITSDTFQSADLQQQLSAEGFNCKILSVDRVQDKVCLPYQYFKSSIYENRIVTYQTNLLTEEIVGLVRYENGKVDHDPSGINCFTGDTKISLVDGREIRIDDLIEEVKSGKINFVYSFNHEKNKIEPKQVIDGWCSGISNKIVEIILDNGEKIRCTPNHKFMLRDGYYCEAKDLICGDSLMPLYRKYPDKGLSNYRMYYDPMEDKWHYEHRQFVEEVLDEKYLVHHKDCNPKNNNPTNLIWCSADAHQKIHGELQTGAQSIEANQKRADSTRKWWAENKDTDIGLQRVARYYNGKSLDEIRKIRLEKQKNKKERIVAINNLFNIDFESLSKEEKQTYNQKYNNYLRGYDVFTDKEKLTNEKRKRAEEYFNCDYSTLSENERRALSIKYARIEDPTYQEKVSLAVSNNHKEGKYKKAYEALQKCNEESHKRKLEKYYASDRYKEILEINALYGIDYESLPHNKKISYIHRYHNSKKKDLKNHKIISITIYDSSEPVYDITVSDNHNFALSAGVFVHNSKDQVDAVCGATYNASLHAEEYAFDYGETLETFIDSNQGIDGSLKKQISADFEEELKSAFSKPVIDDSDRFMDFGFGKAQVYGQQYLSEGILVW